MVDVDANRSSAPTPEHPVVATFTTMPLSRERIAQFSVAMDDPNPVHLDDEFCRSIGLAGVIAPGGMAVVAIAHTVALKYGPHAIKEIDVSLKSPMAVDAPLVCTAEIIGEDGDHLKILCRAADPDGTLRAEGRLKVHAP